MKAQHILATAVFLFLGVLRTQAQAPQQFTYQAVVRDAGNNLVSQAPVGMRLSILQGSTSGPAVYVETHTPTTNANGLLSVAIGNGVVQSGSVGAIDWANGPYFIQTETDPTGGTNYSIIGATQLLSVPYALYAAQGGTPGPQGLSAYEVWLSLGNTGSEADFLASLTGPQGPMGPAGPGLGPGTSTNQVLYWDGVQWITLDPGSIGQVLTLCADGLTWTFGGQCPGGVSGLSCSGAVDNGTLTDGQAASGVSSSVPYTGGTGIAHPGQVVSSTGVTGLTATLDPGTFVNGSGTLTYLITGTPNGSGTASFSLSIGGQSCILTRTVVAGGGSGITDATCGAPNVHNPNLTYGSMTDQDGNEYKTIVIGTQEWMAENLRVARYQNGDAIPVVADSLGWMALATGATCWYANDSAANHCPYGRLYNGYTVMDPRNVCPAGWHVPTDSEWSILTDHLGDETSAGGPLKSAGVTYWFWPNMGGTNDSGFSALPAGGRKYDNSEYWDLQRYNFLWSSTTSNADSNWVRYLCANPGHGIWRYENDLNYGFSIRCIRD